MTAIQSLCSTSSSYSYPWTSTIKLSPSSSSQQPNHQTSTSPPPSPPPSLLPYSLSSTNKHQQTQTPLQFSTSLPLPTKSSTNIKIGNKLSLPSSLLSKQHDKQHKELQFELFNVKSSDQDFQASKRLQEKYWQFMGKQNGVIYEGVVDGVMEVKNGCVDDQITNKLRDNSNQFIKNLLQQLTQLYSKHRSYKSTTTQHISQLQQTLQQEKNRTKQLTQNMYINFSQSSQKCQQYIKLLQSEHRETQLQYQSKISLLLTQIGDKEYYVGTLEGICKEMEGRLRDMSKMLRMEQEKFNEKCREGKGLNGLVEEYQAVLWEMEVKGKQTDAKVDQLQASLHKTEQYNQDLIEELQRLQKSLQQKDNQIGRLNTTIQQCRQASCRYLSQLQTHKQSSLKYKQTTQNTVQQHKNTQKSLTFQIESLQQNLQQIKQQLEHTTKSLLESENKMETYRQFVKIQVDKIGSKFMRREKLIRRACVIKVKELRKWVDCFKEEVLKESFKFYYGVKIDMMAALQETS